MFVASLNDDHAAVVAARDSRKGMTERRCVYAKRVLRAALTVYFYSACADSTMMPSTLIVTRTCDDTIHRKPCEHWSQNCVVTINTTVWRRRRQYCMLSSLRC